MFWFVGDDAGLRIVLESAWRSPAQASENASHDAWAAPQIIRDLTRAVHVGVCSFVGGKIGNGIPIAITHLLLIAGVTLVVLFVPKWVA